MFRKEPGGLRTLRKVVFRKVRLGFLRKGHIQRQQRLTHLSDFAMPDFFFNRYVQFYGSRKDWCLWNTSSHDNRTSVTTDQGLLCYQACHYEILVGPTFLNRNRNQNFEDAKPIERDRKSRENLKLFIARATALRARACLFLFRIFFIYFFHRSILILIFFVLESIYMVRGSDMYKLILVVKRK